MSQAKESGVNPGHLSDFNFCGHVIGLALMHRVQIDMVLAQTFFKQLVGFSISWEYIQDADPFLFSSCKKILETDSDSLDKDVLGLTFVTEVEELEETFIVSYSLGLTFATEVEELSPKLCDIHYR